MIKIRTKMFVSDFDGTLADDNSIVSENAISALKEIGQKGILRVIATGRSLFSLRTVINDNFPIDYLVFSSGIGVYDWKNKVLLQENCINSQTTQKIYDYLVFRNFDFMVQLPVPDNHFFHHFSSGIPNDDFVSRVKYYEAHGVEPIIHCPYTASQFVIICPKGSDYFDEISTAFSDLKVVKATSPIDRESLWIEILPSGISKASGIDFLRQRYNVELFNIITVGNDYYDLDMLRYSLPENSYLVANAPKEIRSEFNIIESNLNDGVYKLIKSLY